MKLKALVLTLFVAGIGASFALADDGGTAGTGSTATTTSTSTSTSSEHHGKHSEHGGSCRPEITVELKGSLASVGSNSFVMDVKHANHHGSALAGTQVTVGVDDRTHIKRHGHATLADLKVGDRLSVKARACKHADAAASAQLVARKVDAHPAKDDHKAKDDHHEHSTTTTTTSTP